MDEKSKEKLVHLIEEKNDENRKKTPSKYQFWSKVIAYVDMVFLGLGVICLILGLIMISIMKNEGVYIEEDWDHIRSVLNNDTADFESFHPNLRHYDIQAHYNDKYFAIGMAFGVIISSAVIIFQFYLNWILLFGAKKGNIKKIKKWLVISAVILVIFIFAMFKTFSYGVGVDCSHLVTVMYRGFTILIVWRYYKELYATQEGKEAGMEYTESSIDA